MLPPGPISWYALKVPSAAVVVSGAAVVVSGAAVVTGAAVVVSSNGFLAMVPISAVWVSVSGALVVSGASVWLSVLWLPSVTASDVWLWLAWASAFFLLCLLFRQAHRLLEFHAKIHIVFMYIAGQICVHLDFYEIPGFFQCHILGVLA